MDTPASLLERLRQPAAPAAWNRFVELYTPVLYAWTRRLGLQPADAADLVQDVFTILVQKLPTFQYDKQKSFHAWLKTVLVNRWRDKLRRPVEVPAGAALVAPDEDALSETEYRRHVVRRALQLMQSDFKPATWRACWEFVVTGKPAEVVARELGLTINAVYLAKSRVLRRLREELHGLLG